MNQPSAWGQRVRELFRRVGVLAHRFSRETSKTMGEYTRVHPPYI
jgi:hypothetical protein